MGHSAPALSNGDRERAALIASATAAPDRRSRRRLLSQPRRGQNPQLKPQTGYDQVSAFPYCRSPK